MFTTEILISSVSILIFGKLVSLTMSKERLISTIETLINVCKFMCKNCKHASESSGAQIEIHCLELSLQ
jgi:hypothetical protein